MNTTFKWTGVSLAWGALVFGALNLAKGPFWQDPEPPEPRYGEHPQFVAEAADCTDFSFSDTQFPPKQLIGDCEVNGIPFEVHTFDTPASQQSYLRVNSVMDEPLYYVTAPGTVFRSQDSTDDNYNDSSVYEPVADAASSIADNIDGTVYTSAQVRDQILGGDNDG